MLVAQGRLRKHFKAGPAVVIPIQFLLGIYGGYFGGAVGLMMMAVWSLLANADLKALNPPRTLMVQPQSPTDLIARQLSDRDRDPVFSESMAVAQTLAKSVLG